MFWCAFCNKDHDTEGVCEIQRQNWKREFKASAAYLREKREAEQGSSASTRQDRLSEAP